MFYVIANKAHLFTKNGIRKKENQNNHNATCCYLVISKDVTHVQIRHPISK